MRVQRFLTTAIVAGLTLCNIHRAQAVPIASATITTNSTGATNSYSLTLKDDAASPSPIGTFWFAWLPGQDFMHTSPLSVANPTGWTDHITGGGAGDGFAIQWVTTSASFDLPAGGTLSGFGFTSADSPASLAGNSTFFPTIPVLTTVSYGGAPFSDAGATFLVTPAPVPEPVSLALIVPGMMLLRRARRPV